MWFAENKSWSEYRRSLGGFSAIVCKDGSTVWAEDASGKTIASGEAGVDDASVIQSALDNLVNGGAIFIRSGKYILESSLSISNYFINLIGEGLATKLVPKSEDVGAVIKIEGEERPLGIQIKSLQFGDYGDGSRASWNVDYIKILKGALIWIEDCFFYSIGGSAINVDTCWEMFIRNIKIENCGRGDKYAIHIEPSKDERGYESNHIFISDVHGGSRYGGLFKLKGMSSYYSEQFQLVNINFYGPHVYDADLTSPYCVSLGPYVSCVKLSSVSLFGVQTDIIYAKVARLYMNNIELSGEQTGKSGVVLDGGNTIFINNVKVSTQGKCVSCSSTPAGIWINGGTFNSQEDTALSLSTWQLPIYLSNVEATSPAGSHAVHITYSDQPVYIENLNYSPSVSLQKLAKNSGTATFSGDGTTTQFSIAHGLVSTPTKVQVTPMSSDAASDFYVTADDTNIYINYKSAPPSGTDNLKFSWYAEV